MIRHLKAAKGKMLPIKINKKLIFIGDAEATQVDESLTDYSTKIQINEALKSGDIVELTPKETLTKKK